MRKIKYLEKYVLFLEEMLTGNKIEDDFEEEVENFEEVRKDFDVDQGVTLEEDDLDEE